MGKTKRQVVVFGATGEIGGRIAKGCVEAGHKVVGISRGTNKRSIPDVTGVEMLAGDRSDEEFLRNAVAPLGFFRALKAGKRISIPRCENVLIQSGSNSDLAGAFVKALDVPDAVRGGKSSSSRAGRPSL